jgi:hypothetical protein
MNNIPCIGCRALFPDVDGPVHRYMESSPGCWASYGEVLVREYTEPSYFGVHRLTVDAYAVQHPGRPSPQSIRSVAGHLISLCLVLERRVAMDEATIAIRAALKAKERFFWLTPPPSQGSVTVADVWKTKTADEHKELVTLWAASVWSAWHEHHAVIRAWLPPSKDYVAPNQSWKRTPH